MHLLMFVVRGIGQQKETLAPPKFQKTHSRIILEAEKGKGKGEEFTRIGGLDFIQSHSILFV